MEEKDIYDLWNSERQDISKESVEYSLRLLINRINLFEHERSARRKRRRKSLLTYAAAAILVPILILLSVKPQRPETYVTDLVYSAPVGQPQKVILPDSTIVYLNSKSVLISPSRFVTKERSVFLIGEAYFKVAKNKEKPFRVKTHLMTIEALGTEFSVLAYSQNDNVKTTLVEGKVQVEAVNREGSVKPRILKPNQQSYYDLSSNEITVKDIDAELYTSWINGNLIFENTPFADVIERLEIQFGKKIEYSNTLKKYRISAKFVQNESLDEILTPISEITYSKVRKVENTYLVK